MIEMGLKVVVLVDMVVFDKLLIEISKLKSGVACSTFLEYQVYGFH